jgi:hypothetical protein
MSIQYKRLTPGRQERQKILWESNRFPFESVWISQCNTGPQDFVRVDADSFSSYFSGNAFLGSSAPNRFHIAVIRREKDGEAL